MNKYKIDTHTHTVSSGHAYSTVTENAKYAASIGLEIIGMTDHAPKMPGSTGLFYFSNMGIFTFFEFKNFAWIYWRCKSFKGYWA